MKKGLFIAAVVAFSACGNAPEKKAPEQRPDKVMTNETCSYSFNAETTTINWLAYKHTDKIGVAGVIDSALFTGMGEADNAVEVFKNAEVTIYPSSVDSKDAGRDKKIKDIFFGAIANSEAISGKIVSISGKDEGEGVLALNMNNVTKELPFKYNTNQSDVKIRFVVDFNAFNGQEAIAALNKACEERHTGTDGQSVLWPDVKITIISELGQALE